MNASLNEVFKAIGSLTAEVSALRRDIQEADQRAAETNRKADEHRATVQRRVDDLVGDLGDIRLDLFSVKKDVRDAKAVTDEVQRWRLMGMGALGVTGIAASATSSVVTYFWDDLARLLRS